MINESKLPCHEIKDEPRRQVMSDNLLPVWLNSAIFFLICRKKRYNDVYRKKVINNLIDYPLSVIVIIYESNSEWHEQRYV